MRPRLASLALSLAVLTGGCGILKDKPYTPSEAEKKLQAFCLKEGQMSAVTRRLGSTLWVYVPLDMSLYDLKAVDPRDSPKPRIPPFTLLSLQSEFSENYFKFNYDIVSGVRPDSEPQTYGSALNETILQKRQLVYAGIQETFFNAKTQGQDLLPQFVVVLVTDDIRGVGIKSIFYLQDFKKYSSQAIPFDEYSRREANEVIGNKKWIKDKTGRNVTYEEVVWSDFLTRQIKGRITYKFTQSDFPPETDPVDEMSSIAANTLSYYPEFTDYKGVVLYGVRDKKETVLDKDALKKLEEKPLWSDDNGKLTTIRFALPQDPTAGVSATTSDSETP